MYDATNIPNSKYVSINDLMKQNKQGFANTIHIERNDAYKTLQQDNLESIENKRRLLKFLATTDGKEDEEALI